MQVLIWTDCVQVNFERWIIEKMAIYSKSENFKEGNLV